jgi:hypothetical protein
LSFEEFGEQCPGRIPPAGIIQFEPIDVIVPSKDKYRIFVFVWVYCRGLHDSQSEILPSSVMKAHPVLSVRVGFG